MEIDVQLTRGPIPESGSQPACGRAGAQVEFRGVVRDEEAGHRIAALEYEAYSPMAEQQMRRILEQLSSEHPCLAATVIHRIGLIPVGEAAIHVTVRAKHRAEAFSLVAQFMNRLKEDVPIWKVRSIPIPEPPPPASRGAAPSAADVIALVQGICPPLETERVGLADAPGRILREPVVAQEDQPPFDRSAVDGYAVRLDDPSTRFRIIDQIRAGEWKPRRLNPGEAVRIATGGALPGDDLQVVMKEYVRVEGDTLTVLERDAERCIRFRGEDSRVGQVLAEPGLLLTHGAVGMLASLGCAHPLVTRLPKVAHIATGSEIVDPGQAPAIGQVRDSNSSLVRAFLTRRGIVPLQRRVGEDETATEEAVAAMAADVDLLLLSGGASVGEHDFTRRLLERAGFTLHVSKTNVRPGKPLIVAQRGAQLAFGLPGNPLAHFVCLNLYVRAALESWSGIQSPSQFQQGVLTGEIQSDGNARETFWPAHWELCGGRASLTPLRWSSSGDLTSLAAANALIRVTAGADALAPGRMVEFIPTDAQP